MLLDIFRINLSLLSVECLVPALQATETSEPFSAFFFCEFKKSENIAYFRSAPLVHQEKRQSSKMPFSAESPSLKKQTTEQEFAGAVAVMAIIHRPALVTPSPGGTVAVTSLKKKADFTLRASGRHDTAGLTAIGSISQFPSTGSYLTIPSTTPSSLSRSGSKSPVPPSQPPSQQQRPLTPVVLHVANVGDCRAVLCRRGKSIAMTRDHTPSMPTEAARIEAAGGFVSRGRVNGILGVSRSFGDIHCKVTANDLFDHGIIFEFSRTTNMLKGLQGQRLFSDRAHSCILIRTNTISPVLSHDREALDAPPPAYCCLDYRPIH